MKLFSTILSVLIGLSLIAPDAGARGFGGGGGKARGGGGGAHKARGGGGFKASPSRQVKRSPMTGSKVQRKTSRPAPKQVSRPAQRPQAKPAARPAQRPQAKPAARPAQRPQAKPSTRPAQRPQTKPAQRPSTQRPGQKPDLNRPGNNRPSGKPNYNRPGNNRPATLPGMVSYPNRPANKPGRPGAGNNNRIGNNNNRLTNNRIGNNTRNNVHIDKVNVNRRNVGLNRPATLPANKRNWNNNRWGGNKGIWGNNNNVNIKINNNFRHNNNFSYRPNYWGAKPWWGANHYHPWHHGHWNYGWNARYYNRYWYYNDRHHDFASGFMWGIGVWSLGNLIYDMGYKTYSNPYPAPPVQNTYINYSEPVSVAAAANPGPEDEAAQETAESKSDEAFQRSSDAFKAGDYMTASKAIDEALGYTPGDVSLHEYRALVFFALGKYGDAAGVLNPVLASGPGWSWDTMIAFYGDSSSYDDQLHKLEDYVKGSPDKADGHFLLGYHYMVCGYMDKSYEQFKTTTELQPADSIARQLRDLTESSLPDEGDADAEPPPAPEPVPVDKLVGTWVSDAAGGGKITFTMKESGDFSWDYSGGGADSKLTGTYGLDDQGLLVLTMDDSQMISEISLKDDSQLKFVMVGSPQGDPGLEFKKG
ncbi:tetratricopeptide repeat protein [Luteolibacter marinus]|uniref:tetratricopeptide repeat protein n=1 Tax=Luteolibacter marinus TaxID=2776705 RepID=UPI0018670D35|nr:tetratricopeptide repeat protein [Luteolibacter marinus]